MQSFMKFLKEITTLRTVWIDKGQGKWVVKKRMHPFLRGVFWSLAIIVGTGAYINFSSISEANKADAQPEIITAKTLPAAEMPEPFTREQITIPMTPTVTEIEAKIQPAPAMNLNLNPGDIFDRPEKLLPDPNAKHRIEISKSKFELALYKGDELIKTYPIATGKNPGDKIMVGDHRTPVGNFKIVSIEPSSKWKHDFGDGKGKIAGAYGPWFLRLDANGWKGIGIHGTHDPDSRGTRATEGCIRLSNEDIDELRQFAYRNMPVTIREN